MQTQLVERYLKDNSCQYRTDYRKDDAPQINLEAARTRYQQQAEALTGQSAGRLLVKSFVLDTALR